MNFRFWRRDLAIDLGTTNTLIYMPRRGIILNANLRQKSGFLFLRKSVI